ncbi:HTH-type transcriptional regulator GbpR [Pigmentiphaga humi]|uniref:HTH-type transcriptional regulator GbpR n=1 Tax=Pigmentiphaga humi TaxID=2478468 RepID=A0A3P4B5X0_9BURK|nr:LysR family transcriptional regulator [Pigmentiphaga humi]VCU70565.1 HTH-type transcriptional regulator GbpR [Pigmentiphaga humi]
MNLSTFPNLRHLRVFEAVGRLQRLGLAAAEQNMTQPAATQAICKLEEQFGATLLTRSQNGSTLTEEGKMLAARLARFFDQINAALSEPLLPANRISVEQIRNRITSGHLCALAALAERAGIDKAAQALAISKPSFQRIVREAARILHRPICQRTAHGIVLTRFGTELSRHMKLATLEIEGAAEQIQSMSGPIQACIKIGIPQLGNSVFLGTVLSELMKKHGEIQLLVTERPKDVLLQELHFGTLDIIYGTLSETDIGNDFVEESLFRDPYCLVVRTGHPLTGAARISVGDLAKYKWIVPRVGSFRRGIYESLFARHARKPKTAIETTSLNIHLSLLQTSDYVTLMKHEEIMLHERLGTLITLPLPLRNLHGTVGITTRAGWHATQAQSHLLEIMREQAARMPPATPHAARRARMPRGDASI